MSKKVEDIKGIDFAPFIKDYNSKEKKRVAKAEKLGVRTEKKPEMTQVLLAKIIGCDGQTITNMKINPSSSIKSWLRGCEIIGVNPIETLTYKK